MMRCCPLVFGVQISRGTLGTLAYFPAYEGMVTWALVAMGNFFVAQGSRCAMPSKRWVEACGPRERVVWGRGGERGGGGQGGRGGGGWVVVMVVVVVVAVVVVVVVLMVISIPLFVMLLFRLPVPLLLRFEEFLPPPDRPSLAPPPPRCPRPPGPAPPLPQPDGMGFAHTLRRARPSPLVQRSPRLPIGLGQRSQQIRGAVRFHGAVFSRRRDRNASGGFLIF